MKAFPVVYMDYIPKEEHQGMDLRDYFAAKALLSIITDGKLGLTLKHDKYIQTICEMSYEYADAMMEARKK